jgi:hypothetical protein
MLLPQTRGYAASELLERIEKQPSRRVELPSSPVAEPKTVGANRLE